MNRTLLLTLALIATLSGCRKNLEQSGSIVSMQICDRNGFSETISNADRLKVYQNVNFLSAQPYEKVLRVYGKDNEGKSHSKITSYHDSGGTWQYLEAIDGRANGKFLEWHENGKVKIEGTLIEGLADLSPSAQKSWLFDSVCTVWDDRGNVEAIFHYDQGQLVDEATFYHPTGEVCRTIPYRKGTIHGVLQEFDQEGNVVLAIPFQEGLRHGEAISKWNSDLFEYQESYKEGLLISGSYYAPNGEKIAEIEAGEGTRAQFEHGKLNSITEYKKGQPEGHVQKFDQNGYIQTSYQLKSGMKTGEEWEYYPSDENERRPKLLITWFEDQIQGMVKTWYENGTLESQREMNSNKKHGLSFAYYRSSDLMMMEEYENGKLTKGSYFKKGEQRPVSEVNEGEGTVTLYNANGHFMKKVTYERGKPVVD